MIDLTDRHPAVTGVLEFFDSRHLPEHLKKIAEPVERLAEDMVRDLHDDPQLTNGLNRLLEAKDCFVRAMVRQTKGQFDRVGS